MVYAVWEEMGKDSEKMSSQTERRHAAEISVDIFSDTNYCVWIKAAELATWV